MKPWVELPIFIVLWVQRPFATQWRNRRHPPQPRGWLSLADRWGLEPRGLRWGGETLSHLDYGPSPPSPMRNLRTKAVWEFTLKRL